MLYVQYTKIVIEHACCA